MMKGRHRAATPGDDVPSLVPAGRPHLRDRRAWAMETLRVHTEIDGTCGYCARAYPSAPAWPCAPASVALDYVGGPPEDALPLARTTDGPLEDMFSRSPGDDPVDRAEAIDEPERRVQPDPADDATVHPADAGFATSPELDDHLGVVTPRDPGGEPVAAAD